MSNDLNVCMFIGRLGKDPESRFLPNGDAVTSFSIAVGESWKKDGEKHEATEWVRCVAWRQLAEICAKYLVKGSQVYVSGKMKTRKWKDKENVDRYTTEIIADRMQILGGGKEKTDETPQKKGMETLDDDVPW